MPTTTITSPTSNTSGNTSGDATPTPASPTQDPEPPEPENTLPPPSHSRSHPQLDITILISEFVSRDHPILTTSSQHTLQHNITQAAHLLHINTGSITIKLITDDEMIDLHTQFCNNNTTTDILSFDLDDPPANQQPKTIQVSNWSSLALRANLLKRTTVNADLALCLDQAERQAEKRNHPLINELTLYAVHGILHMLGHDDHDPDAYQIMHQLEDEILQTLGLPPTFINQPETQ